MPEISVIIPIYNAEKYIEKCINSILNQTFKNIEIILVNDGSTDNSRIICEKYKNKDKRIRLFNIENNGVSSARNLGIESSRGKYIMFCDSDDYVERTWCEELYNLINGNGNSYTGCAITTMNYRNFKYDEKIDNLSTKEYEIISKKEYFCIYHLKLFNSNCNKIYEKKIILDNNIRFDKNLSLGEDLIFNLQYLRYTEDKIIFTNKSLYNYVLKDKESLDNKYQKNLFEIYRYLRFKTYKEAIRYNANNKEFNQYHYKLYYESFRRILSNTFHKDNKTIFIKKLLYNYKILKTKEFKECIKNLTPEIIGCDQKYYNILKSRNYFRLFIYDEDITFNKILCKVKKNILRMEQK